jgi:hypothetical protein
MSVTGAPIHSQAGTQPLPPPILTYAKRRRHAKGRSTRQDAYPANLCKGRSAAQENRCRGRHHRACHCWFDPYLAWDFTESLIARPDITLRGLLRFARYCGDRPNSRVVVFSGMSLSLLIAKILVRFNSGSWTSQIGKLLDGRRFKLFPRERQ